MITFIRVICADGLDSLVIIKTASTVPMYLPQRGMKP